MVDRGRALGPGVQELDATSRSPCSRPAPGGQGSPIGGASFAISRNSQHAAEAYTFIKWLTAPAQQAVFASKNNLLPSHVSAYKLPDVKKNRLIVAFLAQLQKATDRSAGAQGGQLYTDFTPAMQSMLSGKSTPAKAAAAGRGRLEDQALPELHRRQVGT